MMMVVVGLLLITAAISCFFNDAVKESLEAFHAALGQVVARDGPGNSHVNPLGVLNVEGGALDDH